jgi:IS1 family transposase
MNKLTREERVRVIAALVEGNSIRSTVRMTGISKTTISKLLVEIGTVCAEYHDKAVRNLKCKQVQCDEIWSFCYSKQQNVPEDKQGQFGIGDVWTWTAIDSDSKLTISWLIGKRDSAYATEFMKDVASRLANRAQLSTDGHNAYLVAVDEAFGSEIDYAMLIKLYGKEGGEGRYSPAKCTGTKKQSITGKPVKGEISTSFVERQNLTMRMSMRRFTRLTNAFSKKIDNLRHSVALHFVYYNFCRIHQTLRVSPAMAAGITKRLWNIEDIVKLLETKENA